MLAKKTCCEWKLDRQERFVHCKATPCARVSPCHVQCHRENLCR